MTRTSLICSMTMALYLMITPTQAHEPGRVHQCVHCAKPRYSILHYTLPVVYRIKAFARKGTPELYGPVWYPHVEGQKMRLSYTCPPVPTHLAAETYFEFTDVPPHLMTPAKKPTPAQKPNASPSMRESAAPK